MKIIQVADQTIYIPMPGQAESLNVAVAGGILMFYFQVKSDVSVIIKLSFLIENH